MLRITAGWMQERRYGSQIGSFEFNGKTIAIRRMLGKKYGEDRVILSLCDLTRQVEIVGNENLEQGPRVFEESLISAAGTKIDVNIPLTATAFSVLLEQRVYDGLILGFGNLERGIAHCMVEFDDGKLIHQLVTQRSTLEGGRGRFEISFDAFSRSTDPIQFAGN